MRCDQLPEEPPGVIRCLKGVSPKGSWLIWHMLEVACSEDSVLTAEAERQGLTAIQAGLHNGFDLCDAAGLRRLVELINKVRPRHVWVSTECGAFSPLQNLNQRTSEQQAALQKKQREARRQHMAALVVCYASKACGSEVHWEWSRRCRAWSWDPIDRMRRELKTHTAIIGGCRVGLHAKDSQSVVGKEWRVESTSSMFAKQVHLGQECPGTHVACQGQLSRASAFYTPKMAKRVIYYMRQCQDESDPLQLDMSVCQCSMFKWKRIHVACPQCTCGEYSEGPEALVQARPETGPQNHPQTQGEPKTGPQNKPFSKEEEKKWMHKIHLLHGATGHGSYQQLRETLEKKKVDPRILALVDSDRCSICEERKRPAPRRVATLECILTAGRLC